MKSKSDRDKATQTKRLQGEIARKAYVFHQRKVEPGYAEQNWLEAEAQLQ